VVVPEALHETFTFSLGHIVAGVTAK